MGMIFSSTTRLPCIELAVLCFVLDLRNGRRTVDK
jgi:hypothetical protein